MPDKILVTNRSALAKKYGDLAAIEKAVADLIASDKSRGLVTELVAIDETHGVTDAQSPKLNKDAIDALYTAAKPDYLVILGGPEIVPHQDLINPMFAPGGDTDEHAWGDIPYACEAPYSQKIEDFTGPSRVVGRIPDLPGATEPSFLLGVLATAINWKRKQPAEYRDIFGLSTYEWQASTNESVANVAGAQSLVHLSPEKIADDLTDQLLAPRAHFINCHGAFNDPHFYGQAGSFYPISHNSKVLVGKKFDGTVVAAECCYGGQIFAPPGEDGWGIWARYLQGGAYGYFGATTIAYGPRKGNGQADIICQLFLRKSISGSSTGRAALEARQEYIKSVTSVGPQDLKTIAQFNLYGDPSIHPVVDAQATATPAAVDDSAPEAKGFPRGGLPFGLQNPFSDLARIIPSAIDRAERRSKLIEQGLEAAQKEVARQVSKLGEIDDQLRAQFDDLASSLDVDFDMNEVKSFLVGGSENVNRFAARALSMTNELPTKMHLLIGKEKHAAGMPNLPHVVAVFAEEVDGKLLKRVELVSK